MTKTKGAMWVSTTDLHFVDTNANEWYVTGTITASAVAGSTVGAIWVDSSSGTLYYVDTSNNVRSVPNVTDSTPAGATHGATWIDTFLRWIDGSGNQRHLHGDVAYGDVTAYGDYADQASYGDHSDTPAYGDYSDTAHADSYFDVPSTYNDFGDVAPTHYTDTVKTANYSDTPHADGYSDTAYSDWYSDIPYENGYSDVPHTDRAYQDTPVSLGT